MARYRIVFKKSVAKDLRRIPKRDVTRILRRIDALADEELIVTVVKVGHRREIYRRD